MTQDPGLVLLGAAIIFVALAIVGVLALGKAAAMGDRAEEEAARERRREHLERMYPDESRCTCAIDSAPSTRGCAMHEPGPR